MNCVRGFFFTQVDAAKSQTRKSPSISQNTEKMVRSRRVPARARAPREAARIRARTLDVLVWRSARVRLTAGSGAGELARADSMASLPRLRKGRYLGPLRARGAG